MTEQKKMILSLKPSAKKDPKSRTSRGKKTLFVPVKKTECGNLNGDSKQSFRAKPRRIMLKSTNKHKLALRNLEEQFPKVFNLVFPKPLAIGIRDDLIAMNKDISNKQIRLGLFFYCNSHQYLRCVKEGVNRVNSTGRYVKKVTAEEEMDAVKKLRALFAKIKLSKSRQ